MVRLSFLPHQFWFKKQITLKVLITESRKKMRLALLNTPSHHLVPSVEFHLFLLTFSSGPRVVTTYYNYYGADFSLPLLPCLTYTMIHVVRLIYCWPVVVFDCLYSFFVFFVQFFVLSSSAKDEQTRHTHTHRRHNTREVFSANISHRPTHRRSAEYSLLWRYMIRL